LLGEIIPEEIKMDQKKKLSIVIEHWIEHNEAHMGEYKKWAQTAGELALDSVKAEIEEAMEKISQSNKHLEKAKKVINL
jgi:biotin synthase-related radical SAM superfamily protein